MPNWVTYLQGMATGICLVLLALTLCLLFLSRKRGGG